MQFLQSVGYFRLKALEINLQKYFLPEYAQEDFIIFYNM